MSSQATSTIRSGNGIALPHPNGFVLGSRTVGLLYPKCQRPKCRGPLWVKSSKAQIEHKFSGLPPATDIRQRDWHVGSVPGAVVRLSPTTRFGESLVACCQSFSAVTAWRPSGAAGSAAPSPAGAEACLTPGLTLAALGHHRRTALGRPRPGAKSPGRPRGRGRLPLRWPLLVAGRGATVSGSRQPCGAAQH
jgi:hypothetical protein